MCSEFVPKKYFSLNSQYAGIPKHLTYLLLLQNRPMFLMPWLVFNPLAIIIYIIGTLIALVHHGGLNNSAFVAGHLIIGVSCCCKY